MTGASPGDVAVRARDWHHARHTAVCDSIEPWAHGHVVRAGRYPDYWDFNLVRVEDDPGMSAAELAAFADRALAGLRHRRVDIDLIETADAETADELRPGFERLGWQVVRLLFMRLAEEPPPAPGLAVEEADYDSAEELRRAWHREDYPDQDPGDYHAHAKEVALRQAAQVLVVREGAATIAFAQIQRSGDSAEITAVYVHPDRRGNGLGTALTRAAIDGAGVVQDLWIVADDEDRPKELYARLGFRPAWTSLELTRLPG